MGDVHKGKVCMYVQGSLMARSIAMHASYSWQTCSVTLYMSILAKSVVALAEHRHVNTAEHHPSC